ncbi:hypothetical protein OK016_09705 [Vibrio chagasii]|nr:hypothetical protein [Vibrio chagasii]
MARIPDNPLILIDGSSYIARFMLTHGTMSNGDIPTNAVYGVVNMLRSTDCVNLLLIVLRLFFDAKERRSVMTCTQSTRLITSTYAG